MIVLMSCQPTAEKADEKNDAQPKKEKKPKVEEVKNVEENTVNEDTLLVLENVWTNIYARDIELYFTADTNWIEVSLSQQEQIYTMLELAVDELNQELELAVRTKGGEAYLLVFSLGDDYSISEFELKELISSQSDLYANLQNVSVNGLSYFIFDVTNDKAKWQKAMSVTPQGRPFSVDYIIRKKSAEGSPNLEEVLQFLK
jgi:hypothetical protein